MPATLRRKSATLRSGRRKGVTPALSHAKIHKFALSPEAIGPTNGAHNNIEPIPMHPVGSLPVTKFELELEKLAGPDFAPDFAR